MLELIVILFDTGYFADEEMCDDIMKVSFKDVYPWVWSVLFGTSLMLAERRGAFLNAGTDSLRGFFIKNICAIILNVGLPSVLFGLTMINVGPKYSPNLDFWQILGSLYLATVPLGSHHFWLILARHKGWLAESVLQSAERDTIIVWQWGGIFWLLLLLLIPFLIAILGWPFPW